MEWEIFGAQVTSCLEILERHFYPRATDRRGNASLRDGGWQTTVGADLHGKTLGVLGLGNIGSSVAEIGKTSGMNVISLSQNLTKERTEASGAQ
ncbi:MAG: D-isomer specific 2-hydroxyacid dehydrogenase NAD-binding protein [Planctomycetaceae bacterium]|nr:D-isomer specific 2-hydroxyacid dehydrogenase NAD-binding protein [Planctomycetaceae bacterium]